MITTSTDILLGFVVEALVFGLYRPLNGSFVHDARDGSTFPAVQESNGSSNQVVHKTKCLDVVEEDHKNTHHDHGQVQHHFGDCLCARRGEDL